MIAEGRQFARSPLKDRRGSKDWSCRRPRCGASPFVSAYRDDEIAFPMSNVGARDVLWPVMNGAAVFDHIAGRSGPAWPVTAGQIAPQLLALAGGAIDKSIDGLEAEDA